MKLVSCITAGWRGAEYGVQDGVVGEDGEGEAMRFGKIEDGDGLRVQTERGVGFDEEVEKRGEGGRRRK